MSMNRNRSKLTGLPQIIACIEAEDLVRRGHSVTDVAKEMGVPNSSVHGMLGSKLGVGYKYDHSEPYRCPGCGAKCIKKPCVKCTMDLREELMQ